MWLCATGSVCGQDESTVDDDPSPHPPAYNAGTRKYSMFMTIMQTGYWTAVGSYILLLARISLEKLQIPIHNLNIVTFKININKNYRCSAAMVGARQF